jgi:hypothetical protein
MAQEGYSGTYEQLGEYLTKKYEALKTATSKTPIIGVFC